MLRAVVLSMLLALPASAAAQAEATVTMSADRTEVPVGGDLTIEVGAQIARLPSGVAPSIVLPDLSAFDVVSAGAAPVAVTADDGSVTLSQQVSLRARTAGTLTILPAVLLVGDARFESGALTISVGGAQVIEEPQAQARVVERGYVRGEGRGVQYGAHLISPVYLTDVRSPDGARLYEGGGIGVWARVGWEFPLGFTLEVLGGVAANGVDTRGVDASDAFTRADVGVGARYMIFNDTAFVPFVQIGGTARFFWFDWATSPEVTQVNAGVTGALHAAVGAQIELSPYFGIEAGLAIDYTFAADLFAEGLVSLMPFAGVTLYLYDESGN